jgi:RecB family exonuclease
MPLTLITGRANTGKTQVVQDAVRRACADGRLPTLLLPTLPDVRRAREWLAADCPVGIRIDQFERYIEVLWATHGDGRRLVTQAQRTALVRRAAATAVNDLPAGSPGLVRFIADVARRLLEEPLWVFEQAEGGSRWDEAVLDVIRTYVRMLDSAGLVEPGSAARALAGAPPRLEGPLLVHDFADLSASQEALVLGWAEAGEKVYVTLPWEEGFPAAEALGPLASRLRESADEVVECRAQPRAGDDAELLRLEEGLFAAPEVRHGTGSVLLATAIGEEAEAVLVARHAARLAAQATDPDRVAIVLRRAAGHMDALRVALAGAGVAADFDVRVPFGATAFGRALLHLVRFQLSGERAQLMGYLRSPFSGAVSDGVDALERRWRGSRETDGRRLTRAASEISRPVAEALRLARRACGDAAAGPAAWKDLGDLLLSTAHDHAALQSAQDAEADVAAYRAMLRAIAELAAIGESRASEIVAALDDVETTPFASERPGHVQVTEAHRLRARRFDAVIVAGMTASGFSSEGAASPSADFVDRLLCAERDNAQARERLLFYSVVTRARRQLVLTRQAATADGDPVRPSVFWEELLDLYRDPSVEEDAGIPAGAVPMESLGLASLEDAAPSLAPGRSALRKAAAAGIVGADERVASAIRSADLDRGVLRDPEVLRMLSGRSVFSATELERYAQCPYRWFYERAVRPSRIDAQVGPLEAGDLAHRVLRGVYERIEERTGAARVTAETLAEVLALADEVFAQEAAPPKTAPALTLAEEDTLFTTHRRVRDLLTADQEFLCGFAPVSAEMRFGDDDGGGIDLGGFAVRGSIDRVDAGEPGLVIVDYKSGQAPKMADLEKKRLLQLPLYAAVARAVLGRPVVAGFYRSLSAGDNRGFYLSDVIDRTGVVKTDALATAADVDELLAAAIERARAAADGIRAGRIAPEDPAEGACDHCLAATFCQGRC